MFFNPNKKLSFFSKNKKKLLGLLILSYKSNLNWYSGENEHGLAPAFLFKLSEFINKNNCNNFDFKPKVDFIEPHRIINYKKGDKYPNVQMKKIIYEYVDQPSSHEIIKSFNFEKFYSYCSDLSILEWYNFFLLSSKLKSQSEKFYPPDHFWGYIGILIFLLRINIYNKRYKVKIREILNSWQDEFLKLLDENFLEKYSGLKDEIFLSKIFRSKVDPTEMTFYWLTIISPFQKPYDRSENEIYHFIRKMNKLRIIWSPFISHLTDIIHQYYDRKYNITHQGILWAGTSAYDNLYRKPLQMRKEMVRCLQFLKQKEDLDIILDLNENLYSFGEYGDTVEFCRNTYLADKYNLNF